MKGEKRMDIATAIEVLTLAGKAFARTTVTMDLQRVRDLKWTWQRELGMKARSLRNRNQILGYQGLLPRTTRREMYTRVSY
jgi:hypothetical protein